MKNFYSIKKQVTVIILSLLLFSFGFNVKAQLPFSDGFESGNFTSGNWTVTGNSEISTTDPYEGNYCVKGPSTWKIEKVFNSISENVITTEFAMKASQTGSNSVDMKILDVNDQLLVNVFFRHTGYICAYDGYGGNNSSTPLLAYNPDTWYKIKIVMNIQTQSYDVYIDGVLKADDFDFFTITNQPPKTFYWRSMESWGTGWVDCVNIYTGTTGINEPNINEQNVQVFPNPVVNILKVKGNNIAVCNIYSFDGKIVRKVYLNPINNNCQINVSNLSNGIYLFKFFDRDFNYIRSVKVFKKKI